MSNKPIFVATHPRACSTAFERVFMTRPDILHCVHEPFGDAFYYGPERLSPRFEDDEEGRQKSGFAQVTYKDVVDALEKDIEDNKEKRLFIKDIIYYLFSPDKKPTNIAPSLRHLDNSENLTNGSTNGTNGSNGYSNGSSTNGTSQNNKNPTTLPTSILSKFHYTFLIRHPRRAIPSYYRCTIPPLDAITGFYEFLPSEAGYTELRRFFDYIVHQSHIVDGQKIKITVVDADDLLDHPAEIIERYCNDVGIPYDAGMLKWGDSEDGQQRAKDAFEKWKGFHEDALGSTELRPRVGGPKILSEEEENKQWAEKYGEKAARMIRQCVDDNVADYEYLKQWAMKV
ncbi:P-loop containing nucleoside triphosphate hydrolase protein [Rhypophila decipiens]|uniref:P-loop containing nucleoside triphosphate hydrolase protein n=1 Tax=Rhypophila decipiens TaxID=261697 RepID=A0AAN6YF44_9PEZI|nr:P-loop containing nucleoside triphosphate hydrolase protein [Rhypophila decipiens]